MGCGHNKESTVDCGAWGRLGGWCRVCAANEQGEIRIRGFLLFDGYYKQPEETARVIDDQGWFRTGDLGSLDAEGRMLAGCRGRGGCATDCDRWLSFEPGVEDAIRDMAYGP
mgnify:CR=1 FL=1